MYTIELSKKVYKFLKKSPKYIRDAFIQKIEVIKVNPFDVSLDVVKLENTNSDYRLRIGWYRFLFTILEDETVVFFFDSGSRWDIYK